MHFRKKNQELLVLQAIRELDVLGNEMNQIIHAWKSGDSKKLEHAVFKSFDEYPEIYNKFIVQRNYNWLPRIETFLKQKKNYLVVVGSLHLLGSDGLINLLQKKGYVIEQL